MSFYSRRDFALSNLEKEKDAISEYVLRTLAKLEEGGFGTLGNGRIAKGAPVRIFVRDVAVAFGYGTGLRESVSAPVLTATSSFLRTLGFSVTLDSNGKRFVSL